MYSSKGFPLDDSSAPCGNGFVVASVSQPALNTKSRGEGFTYFEGSTITVAPNVEVPRIDALPYQTWVSAENAPPAKKSRLDDAMPAGVCPVPEGDFSTLNSPARTDTSRGTPSIDVHAVPGTPLSIQTIVEVPPQSFQSSFEGIHKERCEVCGDEPSGNHYGALCCDGCKGFFKRSTVSGQTYHCRFRNACDIGATNRNSCRACRFKKCLKVGMRIQKSKDIDDIRRWFAPDQQLDGNLLMEARRVFLGADRIALFQPAYEVGKSYREVSSVHEVRDAYLALHDSFTRWARGTPMLWRLSLSDSVALAEAGAAERFILDILHRSQGKNYYDLGSNFLFTKLGIVPAHNDTVAIFFASLASTMGLINDLKATDREFSYLRALSYFNQPLENDQSRETVKNLRNHFLRGLESEQAGLKRGSDRFVKLSVILRRTVTLSRRLSDLLSRAVLTEVATCQ